MKPFKQKYLIVMESGKVITWIGDAKSFGDGFNLAVDFAEDQTGEKVWDFCNCPIL